MFALEELAELRRHIDALEAEFLAGVAEYDRSGAWYESGFLTTAAALRHACRMNAGQASAHVALGRKLAALPEVAGALAAGEISRAHAQVIADAFTPARADALEPLQRQLVNAARDCTPGELRSVVRYATDAVDHDRGALADTDMRAQRRWHMSRTFEGVLKIDAVLTGDDAEVWETAIGAAMEHDRVAADTRSPAQWRADAATSVVRGALDRGDVGNHRKVRPHVTVVVDLDDLPGATPELVELVRTERRYRGSLSRATLDRIMCDCDITRVVMTGESEVLDVGRAQRTVSRAQWSALVARDRHCVAPHCDAPPERCEAHHRRRWGEGGPTDIANLELLCWRHHRQRHSHPIYPVIEQAA